tara:strand:- start:803 stop:1273 length:471 start_codon:yes stop_codon:yes gene_type:complete
MPSRARLAADFGSVYLGVTSATAANLLDDYEEGTWTGTFTATTSAPSTAVTVAGGYTKVGDFVNAWIYFASRNTTGIEGSIQITGLPFTNGATVATGNCLSRYMHSTGGSASSIYLAAGDTTLQMIYGKDTSIWLAATARVSTAGYFVANVAYKVA